MKFRFLAGAMALGFACLLLVNPAFAFSIDIGGAISSAFGETINAVIGGVISIAVGWLWYTIQSKLGISIEDSYRDGLTTFLQRQAASLVAQGDVKLQGVKIDVASEGLAAAANAALLAIPQIYKYFGLTPARVAEMIVDYIPKVPSVAQAQAVALDVANPTTPSQPAT
jgi:hypothetical protein